MAPLVSCVMITAGRPELVGQSTGYFLRQEHPERELVIVHEDPADLPAEMPEDPRVRTALVPRGLSLGEKRNEGARLARGSILLHWDDDDWHGPRRIQHQIAPILRGHADITGLSGTLFFEPATWTFWACRPDLFARLFVNDVHGGTLAYRREVWLDMARYPPRSLREDADFMVEAMCHGARLARLPADDTYLYVRHGANTWRFEAGRCLDPGAWARVGEPRGFAADRPFYERMRAGPESGGRSRGLVSCIMPTFERPAFVARAARHFLRQHYADRELVVVDDGAVSAEPSVPRDDRIRYHRLPARASIGAKRNVACEMARGEVILHWDDDDWMAPTWIGTQVEALTRTGADVVGLSRPYFYDPAGRRAWRYEYPARGRPWVHGGTLCYPRALWRRTPFADTSLGEDQRFLWSTRPKHVVSHDHCERYVAYVHDRNASKKPGRGPLWRPCGAHEVERLWIAAARDSGA